MSLKMREGLQYITFVTATSLLTQSLLLTLFSMVYVMIQNVIFFFFFCHHFSEEDNSSLG